MKSPPDILLDGTGRLDSDLACIMCGHNLRGLALSSVCDECGHTVEQSLRGARFNTADPDWVTRLLTGVEQFLLVLPWLWLPLTWPVAWCAGWCLAAPDPERARDAWLSGTLRILLVLVAVAPIALAAVCSSAAVFSTDTGELDVPAGLTTCLAAPVASGAAALLAWCNVALWRLRSYVSNKQLKHLIDLSGITSAIGVFVLLLGLGGPYVWSTMGSQMDALAAIGGLCLLVPILLLPVILFCLWRQLRTAYALTRADRLRFPHWCRATVAQAAMSRHAVSDTGPAAREPGT